MKFGVNQMATATLGGILFSLVLLTGSCDAGMPHCHGTHNCTIYILLCQQNDKIICIALLGVGGVVILLLIILITTCVVVTSLVAKGIRYLIKHPLISTATSEQRDIEQNQRQRWNRGSQQANAVRTQTDPQYDTVDGTDPSHYFELEPPEEMSGRITKSGSYSSKLHSLPELATAQTNGATYNELTGLGHCKQNTQPTTSLPQSIPQYSSFSTENIPEKEKLEEPTQRIPIYSMPDKSKKTNAKQKAKEKEKREIKMSRSRTADSFSNTKLQNMPEQGDDLVRDKQAIIQRTPSPPPPMLPPKPGQKKVQVEDGSQNASNEESFYSEVSSKPLQDDTPGKACTQQSAPSATTTVVSITSPFHVNPQKSSIPRSFSTLDNVQQRGTHSQKPTDPLQKQLYDMPLDLFLSYGKEDRIAEQTINNV